jgi:hypothetical protein
MSAVFGLDPVPSHENGVVLQDANTASLFFGISVPQCSRSRTGLSAKLTVLKIE